jgi:hypothetical protein
MTLNQIKEDLEAMGVRYKDKDFQDPHANIRNYSNIENTIHSLRNNKRVHDIILVSNLAVNSLGRLGAPNRKEILGKVNQHSISNIKAYAMLLYNKRTERPYIECRVYLCNEKQAYYSPSADDYDAGYNKESSAPPHILYRWNDKLTIENKDGTAVHIRV